MIRRPSTHVLFAPTLIITAALSLPAAGGSIVQSDPFSFELIPIDVQIESVINGSDTVIWGGFEQVLFNPFDTTLGTLNKVTLNVQMNIDGTLYYYEYDYIEPVQYDNGYTNGSLPFSIQALGEASSGPLLAPVDFDDYEVGVDGEVQDDFILIYESGEGMDMTINPGDLPFFTGPGDVPVDLAAGLIVDYDDNQFGNAELFTASGTVGLTYDYTDNNTEPRVIPSPLALPTGILALAGIMLHRRRA